MMHSQLPDRVARDVYPLPLLPTRSTELNRKLSRATGRRPLRGQWNDRDAQFCARGLSAC